MPVTGFSFHNQKLKNFTEGKIKYSLKYKIAIYLSLALQEGRLSGVKIFQLSKHDISSLFLFLLVIFVFLDPDPADQD
jgi:hypothetical protein